MSAGVKLNTTELDRIAKTLKTNARRVGEALAFRMEAEMKKRAAVDTGAMKASIYTVTQEGGTKPNVANAETSDLPKPSGNVVAVVGPSVDYAPYVEMGTSRSSAQPFVIPGAEAVSREFNSGQTWKELFE